METIKLETYPNMFIDYEAGIENPEYDLTIRVFEVPRGWAVDWVYIVYRMGFDDFLTVYTWDDTFAMYEAAYQDGVLVSTCVERR